MFTATTMKLNGLFPRDVPALADESGEVVMQESFWLTTDEAQADADWLNANGFTDPDGALVALCKKRGIFPPAPGARAKPYTA